MGDSVIFWKFFKYLFFLLICLLCVSLDQSKVAEARTEEGEDTGKDGQKTTNCFQCINYDSEGKHYAACPKTNMVDVAKVYSGTCNGTTCFTRSFNKENINKVGRGCVSTQWGMPHPLPRDGCYDWLGDTWCLCSEANCNGGPLGRSIGVAMDDHLYTDDAQEIVEEDGQDKCFECINKDSEGNYYTQCPKNSRARNAYLAPCNGSCFTRSYGEDDEKVARGCTDTQWGLPDPLPPDGCYTWYLDVWCVCSTTRCNRRALGPAKDIEFDAHIPKDGDGDGGDANTVPSILYMLLLAIAVFIMRNIL